ncbi:MAG TPA: DUF4157 domain-containing protein [Kofleriaceae bacterium]
MAPEASQQSTRSLQGGAVHRRPDPGGGSGEARAQPASIEGLFGRGGALNDGAAAEALDAAAQSPGQPVAPAVRERIEAAGGVDLSGVRVHDGPASARAASAISAQAYADGQDVHFAAGQHRPGTPEGDRLLAHELAHTIQARSAGGGDALHGKREVSDAGDAHEVEADAFADAVMQGGAVPSLAQAGGGARAARKLHRNPAPAPRLTQIARVPPGVLLTDGVKDPITDALTREIWVAVGIGDHETFYVNCPADGTPHFVDATGAPVPGARSFGRAQYDTLVQNPRVQQVAGAGAAAQAEACAAALRAAFDQRDGQAILRQLNLGPATVRAAVAYYDAKLNNLGGHGLVGDIQQRFPALHDQAVIELRAAGVVVDDDTGIDLARDPTGASRDQNAQNTLAAGLIVASPAGALVTPGTSITYSVQLPDMLTRPGYTVHGAWSCLRDSSNDPATNAWDPLLGPTDSLSWQVTWTEPGVQKLEVGTYGSWPDAPGNIWPFQNWQNDPRVVMLRYTQVVLPQQVAADAAFATSAVADPAQKRAQLQKYLDYIAPAGQPAAPADAAAVSAIRAQIAAIDDLLAPAAGRQRTPIHAIHLAEGTGQVTPLQVLVVSPDAAAPATATATPVTPAGPRTWTIIDATTPGDPHLHGSGTGTAASDADAIRAAIEDWRSRVQYPRGVIKLEVPASVAHEAIAVQFESNGNSAEDLAELLLRVGGTVGTIGFIGMLLCPVLGLAAFASLFGAMAITGAAVSGAGAAVHAGETAYYRTGTAASYAIDLLTIATSFFVVGGAIGEGAQILSSGVLRGFVVGGLASGTGQFLVMQEQYIEQVARAMQIQDPKARLDALLSILGDAVVNDGLMLIALNKGVDAYRKLGTLVEPAVAAAELLDPTAQIETGTSILDVLPEDSATIDPVVPVAPTGDVAAEPGPISQSAIADPELAVGGLSDTHETTAAAVPGSEFQGGVRPADPAAVMARARAAFEAAAGRFEGVVSVEHASSGEVPDRQSYSAGAKQLIADTYVIAMSDGSSFTVRITSGPLDSDAVARTVVNTTKVGITRVTRPGASGPVEVEVTGRYVIQLNETMDPAVAERAIAHEVGEILAERELVIANLPAGADLLAPGAAPEPGAVLSPHDRGRIGEIKVLAQRVNAGDPAATREMLALIEELGLRDGTPNANQRQELVTLALGEDDQALQALERTWKADAQLDPELEAQLDAVRQGRQAYRDQAAAGQATDQPLHALPDARPEPGTIITPERAMAMALDAENARAARSAETVADLRARAASAPDGSPPSVGNVQIGGGASLAARDPSALLIDARGRWQADPSARIAQTASQLAGLKAAGIGDPFQFAGPDERVPVAAVRYWEDTIAAQGPVIDGKVTGVALDGQGKTVITIEPGDGRGPIRVEVEGTIVAATGFPDERLPGTPRGMTPDRAIDQIITVLEGIAAEGGGDPALQPQAQAMLDELGTLGHGLETEPGQRATDLAKVKALIARYGLGPAIQAQAGDAYRMVLAGDAWNALTAAHPDRFVLGDTANLASMNPMATDNWVIGGLGGTGISAAEIIFETNPNAHVTMIGPRAPEGLMENDQFRSVVRDHADLATARTLGTLFGITVPTTSDGRFSLAFNVSIDSVGFDHGQVALTGGGLPDGIPAGYDQASNPLTGAGGYISAIGRDNQLPAVFAQLADSVEAQGGKVTMTPMYDAQGRYTNYRLFAVDASGTQLQSFDVTGAASRFPPWELFAGSADELANARARFDQASDLDAPPESGNFEGGFVSSATQANAYGRAARDGGMR